MYQLQILFCDFICDIDTINTYLHKEHVLHLTTLFLDLYKLSISCSYNIIKRDGYLTLIIIRIITDTLRFNYREMGLIIQS